MEKDHNKFFVGRVKLVIAREFPEQQWETITSRIWTDAFDYSNNYGGEESYINDVIHMSDLQQDYTAEVVKLTKDEKAVGVFELVAEVHGESWKSWTDCGYEYDAREWLENVRIHELKDENLNAFKEEQWQAWKEYFGEEVTDAR